MIPVFVISLGDSIDRRATIAARLDALGVPFAFIDAVDGRNMSDADIARLCPGRFRLSHRWPLSKGEIGCTASHLEAMRTVVAAGLPFACILEDDADPQGDFTAFLDPRWLTGLPRFDLLKLAGDASKLKEMRAVVVGSHAGRNVCVPLNPSYSTRAYIVSIAGARRVLARSPHVEYSSDVYLFRAPHPATRFLDIRPFPVGTTNVASTLAAERWAQAPASAWRPLLTWLPHRTMLMGQRVRRLVAFLRSQGIGGLRRLRTIPVHDENA